VFCGIHLDRITREEIDEIRNNVRLLAERLTAATAADGRGEQARGSRPR
jgi:hypothetical protein